MKRAWRDYYADATDYATGFEQVATQGLNGVSSTLTSVLWKRTGFRLLFPGIGQMLTELAIQASMARILVAVPEGSLLGWIGSLFNGGRSFGALPPG